MTDAIYEIPAEAYAPAAPAEAIIAACHDQETGETYGVICHSQAEVEQAGGFATLLNATIENVLSFFGKGE